MEKFRHQECMRASKPIFQNMRPYDRSEHEQQERGKNGNPPAKAEESEKHQWGENVELNFYFQRPCRGIEHRHHANQETVHVGQARGQRPLRADMRSSKRQGALGYVTGQTYEQIAAQHHEKIRRLEPRHATRIERLQLRHARLLEMGADEGMRNDESANNEEQLNPQSPGRESMEKRIVKRSRKMPGFRNSNSALG